MHRATRYDIGRRMAVVFIETKTRDRYEMRDGEEVRISEPYVEERVISLATVQAALGVSFRITGLNAGEARDLALLLRAGALAADMFIAEERTVGASLGQQNIELGATSVMIGLALVVVFMVAFYQWFGVAANLALTANMVLIIAMMSALSATLTLPGIAGIVLTVGMAVDANVLIFSRIKEELKKGAPPQARLMLGLTCLLSPSLTRTSQPCWWRSFCIRSEQDRERIRNYPVHWNHDFYVHRNHGYTSDHQFGCGWPPFKSST